MSKSGEKQPERQQQKSATTRDGLKETLKVVSEKKSEKPTTAVAKAKLSLAKSAEATAAKAPPALKATPVPRTVTLSREITPTLIAECKERLLNSKSDLMNRIRDARGKLDQFERGGDEADQTMRILAEQEMLNLTDRLRHQLMEIESALGRIESGAFGYCEETEEAIEIERLKALPWTRLSIEGAEIRESVTKRFAKG